MSLFVVRCLLFVVIVVCSLMVFVVCWGGGFELFVVLCCWLFVMHLLFAVALCVSVFVVVRRCRLIVVWCFCIVSCVIPHAWCC